MAEIDYDPAKSREVYRRHGFTLAYASRIFNGDVLEWSSPRETEHRVLAIGYVDDKAIAVIYTWRYGRRRLITARPARRKERDAFREE
jgi:hypothetical protein